MRPFVHIAIIVAALPLAGWAQTAPTELKPDADGDANVKENPKEKDTPKEKDAPKSPAENLEAQRVAQKNEVERSNTNLPIVSVKRIEDAVQVRLEGGQLVVKTSLPEADSLVKLDVAGLGGFTTMLVQGKTGNGMSEARNIQFEHWDFSTPGTISIHTSISAMPGNVNIARFMESLGTESSVQLIQNFVMNEGERTVWLHVQKSNNSSGRTPVNLHLSAPSIPDLRRLQPHETAEYLQPIFRDLGQEAAVFSIDPRIGWQVFADAYKPSDEERAKVNEIIKQLDADNFQNRQKASDALAALGEPAAMVLTKTDRSKLSAEQNGRIDSFLASYLPLPSSEADTLRAKPDFLLDCLYTSDAFVRTQALAQLEKVSGKKLEFDPSLEGEARFDAVAKLRGQLNLGPTTQGTSTTQP